MMSFFGVVGVFLLGFVMASAVLLYMNDWNLK